MKAGSRGLPRHSLRKSTAIALNGFWMGPNLGRSTPKKRTSPPSSAGSLPILSRWMNPNWLRCGRLSARLESIKKRSASADICPQLPAGGIFCSCCLIGFTQAECKIDSFNSIFCRRGVDRNAASVVR